MKKTAIVFISVLTALLGMTGLADATDARPAADVTNCQHENGYGTVVSAAYVKRYDGAVNLGAIQLCKDSSSNYWGFVIFYDTMPTGNWGYAYLARSVNGTPDGLWGCNSPGGNDFVDRRQTRCWTPKIRSTSSAETFLARGTQCEGTFPTCSFLQGEGYTARTR
jgi:hypothetical protein